jgi:hypothetical protein
MNKFKITLTISGTQAEVTQKANGLAIIAENLSPQTITALAHLIQTDPAKIEMAKKFLGVG